jgi:hypothetical protein
MILAVLWDVLGLYRDRLPVAQLLPDADTKDQWPRTLMVLADFGRGAAFFRPFWIRLLSVNVAVIRPAASSSGTNF